MKYLKLYEEIIQKVLDVSHSDIRNLPELWEGLEELYCHNTNISYLPDLPKSLKVLYCWDTQIDNQFLYKEYIKDYCKKNNIDLII